MEKIYKQKKGFTLLELLVVISIIGLITTIAIAFYGNANAKSRDAVRIVNIKNLQKAFELYNDENGQYPPGLEFTGSVTFLHPDRVKCLDGTGFKLPTGSCSDPIFFPQVHIDPSKPSGANVPPNPFPKYCQPDPSIGGLPCSPVYGFNPTLPQQYSIAFRIETNYGGISKGYHTINQDGKIN